MSARLAYPHISPEAYQAMLSLEKVVMSCGLEKSLLYLVKLLASSINGCAFCIDLHTREARMNGESDGRLTLLNVWREAPGYTDRERAAFAWTESVTRIGETHAPQELYDDVRRHFAEKEMVDLTWAIAAINAWNRISISFRTDIPVRAAATKS